MSYTSITTTSTPTYSLAGTVTWQDKLHGWSRALPRLLLVLTQCQEKCKEIQINPPVFEIMSDRRGMTSVKNEKKKSHR